jgi:hypothetical protein
MRLRTYLSLGIISLFLLYSGCKENSTEAAKTAATLSGRVVDRTSGNIVVGAQIVDQGSSAAATSDASGNFTLSFGILSSNYATTLLITHSGYADTTLNVSVKAGEAQTLASNIVLRSNSSGVIVTDPTVYTASKIAYVSTVPKDGGINIAGVGGIENAVLTYEVQNKLGDPITKTPKYGAVYSLAFYPNSSVGGGTWPTIIPSTDSTDANGQLRVSIASGSQAGVAEIKVRVTIVRTPPAADTVIASDPVKVSIYGGYPDQDHFTILASRFVFPNMDALNTIPFTVAVGDTFSNPVKPGTAIYFHSQAGIMSTGTPTDANGFTTANLYTVNPAPNHLPYYDPTIIDYVNGGPVGRIGYEWVVAQTEGRNGVYIKDSVFVVWNQAPIIVTGLPASITMVSHGTSSIINIVVTDANNNPLCDGTQISASFTFPPGITGLQFKATGNIPSTIPIAGFARFHGSGITDFSFRVADVSLTNTADMVVSLDITVDAPGLEKLQISIPVVITP